MAAKVLLKIDRAFETNEFENIAKRIQTYLRAFDFDAYARRYGFNRRE
ncbi:MAG: hypothetical protein ABJM43_18565 [Paracoccaceae bacterium]